METPRAPLDLKGKITEDQLERAIRKAGLRKLGAHSALGVIAMAFNDLQIPAHVVEMTSHRRAQRDGTVFFSRYSVPALRVGNQLMSLDGPARASSWVEIIGSHNLQVLTKELSRYPSTHFIEIGCDPETILNVSFIETEHRLASIKFNFLDVLKDTIKPPKRKRSGSKFAFDSLGPVEPLIESAEAGKIRKTLWPLYGDTLDECLADDTIAVSLFNTGLDVELVRRTATYREGNFITEAVQVYLHDTVGGGYMGVFDPNQWHQLRTFYATPASKRAQNLEIHTIPQGLCDTLNPTTSRDPPQPKYKHLFTPHLVSQIQTVFLRHRTMGVGSNMPAPRRSPRL